ncbi:hypothetical protein K402DRAFT_366404 [Aulographum hederae CBS 113979]|uniref:RRM domain-containing protein n=1 Tax=Aulographum hederae CBS 113979 TaxID=1176131 RepID=A0A6G1HGT7_9PEZI|nr:hypothetical protein K402DRAFT_366404 [Aulographum hederae CBS 113979]
MAGSSEARKARRAPIMEAGRSEKRAAKEKRRQEKLRAQNGEAAPDADTSAVEIPKDAREEEKVEMEVEKSEKKKKKKRHNPEDEEAPAEEQLQESEEKPKKRDKKRKRSEEDEGDEGDEEPSEAPATQDEAAPEEDDSIRAQRKRHWAAIKKKRAEDKVERKIRIKEKLATRAVRKELKRTRAAMEAAGVPPEELPGAGEVDENPRPLKKSRKAKKSKTSENVEDDPAADEDAVEPKEPEEAAVPDEDENEEEEATAEGGPKKSRFIVFVGNLPFTVSKDDLAAHFASVQPKDIRLLEHRADKKFQTDMGGRGKNKTKKIKAGQSKGYAFMEFDNYDRMKTCLAKFHHTIMGKGKEAREINIELTAGGGGAKSNRMDKIKEKNAKLNEERTRRADFQKMDEEAREKGGAKKKFDAGEEPSSDIHPSRLKQMNSFQASYQQRR